MKVLSEPLLQNVAEMDTQVYPRMTEQPLDPLVAEARAAVPAEQEPALEDILAADQAARQAVLDRA